MTRFYMTYTPSIRKLKDIQLCDLYKSNYLNFDQVYSE
jgi:hypothetical protein